MSTKKLISFFKNLINLKKNDEALTVNKKELESTYLFNNLSNHNYKSNNYPYPFYMEEKKIFAYNLYFICTCERKIDILNTILLNFKIDQTNEYRQAKGKNDSNESIHFSIVSGFNGYLFQIVTNSIKLLNELDILKIEPPPPWISFPEIDPDSLGSLQGSIDYWWYVYWTPFWEKLTPQEKQDYYKIKNATPEWIECIEIHN
ncbi:hypothetical protein GCL60_11850 [Silvanigrella paludirubra]|uniref:Uncharacterized protein n=1 Tax=Silvanigrella paludirubra TaxID=2499159 RepID=A0A6N6VUJ7_9BACT|nr:hypothetical protein [Silvanigrella paludirubra]KAB8037861.1 hypothetical protein GCL60_11850 [Silvanigrella paludirubra]